MGHVLVAILLGIIIGNFWIAHKISVRIKKIEKHCASISRTNETLERQVRTLQSEEPKDD